MYLFLCNKSPQHLVVIIIIIIRHNNSHLLSVTVSQSSGSGLEYLMRLQSDVILKALLGLEDSLPGQLIHLAGELALLLARGLIYSPQISVDRKSCTLTSVACHIEPVLLQYGNGLHKDITTRRCGSLGALFEASYHSLPCYVPHTYKIHSLFPQVSSKIASFMPQVQAVVKHVLI